MTSLSEEAYRASIAAWAGSPEFRQQLVDLLMETCRIDTTTNARVEVMREAESKCFDIIETFLDECGFAEATLERRPIDCAIAEHPLYSNPAYTKLPDRPMLNCDQTYEARSNLLLFIEGEQPKGLAINGHIDVVHPYVPPRHDDQTVFGRGACDDKGPVVSLLGALALVRRFLDEQQHRLVRPLTAMFVIEEEMGGNGSLSCAADRSLKNRYDEIMILECCSSRIYPGNRGAVWYQLDAQHEAVNLFEASAFIVGAMEDEGAKIRSESDHPLFPHRPVQTCHGIIGPWGEHPSRICGLVAFDVAVDGGDQKALMDSLPALIDQSVDQYVSRYGDKTKENDPTTGKPKVDHHYDLEPIEHGWRVTVHGRTGHMGSVLQNDGAITKMATIVRHLVAARDRLSSAAGATVSFRLHKDDEPATLRMEGGQGFLPTHPMADVQQRLRDAVMYGMKDYLNHAGIKADPSTFMNLRYDKLHNDAFAGAPDSPIMRDALAAADEANLPEQEPIVGWDVSCDARLFATEYPDIPVVTTGPGHLRYAHADDEQIDIDEMVRFAEFLARLIIRRCGVAPRDAADRSE